VRRRCLPSLGDNHLGVIMAVLMAHKPVQMVLFSLVPYPSPLLVFTVYGGGFKSLLPT